MPKRIKEHKRDFKLDNFSNALVIHNISKNLISNIQTSLHSFMIKTNIES